VIYYTINIAVDEIRMPVASVENKVAQEVKAAEEKEFLKHMK